jgi:hypothetical protein
MNREDDSRLGKSLSCSGLNSVRSLLELKNDAINNLYFINEAGDKVKPFSWEQGCIRILQSYTNHRSDTCNPIYDWMSITPEMYDEYRSNGYDPSILPRPLKKAPASPYKRMKTTTSASLIKSSQLPSSPTKMNNTPPKLFKSTTPKKINTSTNRDNIPHCSSGKTTPPTKVEDNTPHQSNTYGEKNDTPTVSSSKDEFTYVIEEIMSLNQTSRDRLIMYGYDDIQSIIKASKDDIFHLELRFNDRRCIQAFKLFCVHNNSTHCTIGNNWMSISKEDFHVFHVNSIYHPFSVATKSSSKSSSIPTRCVLEQESTQSEPNIQDEKMNEPSLPSSVHGIPCLDDIFGESLNISTSVLSSNQEDNNFKTSSQHCKREKSPLLYPKEDTQDGIRSEDNKERLEEQNIP